MGWREYGYNYDGFNAKKLHPGMPEAPIQPTGNPSDSRVIGRKAWDLRVPSPDIMHSWDREKIMAESGAENGGLVNGTAQLEMEEKLATMARNAAGFAARPPNRAYHRRM